MLLKALEIIRTASLSTGTAPFHPYLVVRACVVGIYKFSHFIFTIPSQLRLCVHGIYMCITGACADS